MLFAGQVRIQAASEDLLVRSPVFAFVAENALAISAISCGLAMIASDDDHKSADLHWQSQRQAQSTGFIADTHDEQPPADGEL